jgi:Domain of unknown function (DUF4258)
MNEVAIHPHAHQRALERGATIDEITETVEKGEQFPVKYGRTGFRKNFSFNGNWNGTYYLAKQIECYCVKEDNKWLVITVIVKFF